MMKTKTVIIDESTGGVSRRDIEYINDIVIEALRDMDIEPASFGWHIEVYYYEGEE
jgi:hypothetical protein